MHRHGLVVGKFAPFHKEHEFLVEEAVRGRAEVTVLVYSNPDFPSMPQSTRANWIRALYPKVTVHESKGAPDNASDDETHRAFVRQFLERNGISVDTVYTSEDYGPGFASHLNVEHVSVDLQRTRTPVSGRALRDSPYSLRHFLSPLVYRHFVRTAVFLGAESTGKSTLARHLAGICNTTFVHEYGRDHYAERGGVLELDDYVTIAQRHREIEDRELMNARDFLFVDTNPLTTLFYSYYYNGAALAELHRIADECLERYDYSFVCDIDIPFEQDGWRDNAMLRDKMQRIVLMDLGSRRVPYQTVSGTVERRARRVLQTLSSPTQAA